MSHHTTPLRALAVSLFAIGLCLGIAGVSEARTQLGAIPTPHRFHPTLGTSYVALHVAHVDHGLWAPWLEPTRRGFP
jgi:hypothetical protein